MTETSYTRLLQNKKAVITGANRGIGKAILENFASNGATLIACSRTVDEHFIDECKKLSDMYKVDIFPLVLDLENQASFKDAIKVVKAQIGPPDILVNNAGIASGGLFQMTSTTEMLKVFEINFFAQIAWSQLVARLMTRSENGSIINISSTAAEIADPGTLIYGASKAALSRATKSMATELGASDIRVNAIAPGVTRTDMLDQMDEQAREKLIHSSALKKIAEPQDIANAALFLASDLSSHITAQVIRVDGGIV